MPANQNRLTAGSRVLNNHSPTVSRYRLMNSVHSALHFILLSVNGYSSLIDKQTWELVLPHCLPWVVVFYM